MRRNLLLAMMAAAFFQLGSSASAEDFYGTWYWYEEVVSDNCDGGSPPGTVSVGLVSVLAKSGNEVWVHWFFPARPQIVGTVTGNALTYTYQVDDSLGYRDTTVTTFLAPTADYTDDRIAGTSEWERTDTASGGMYDCNGSDEHIALRHYSFPGSLPADFLDFFSNFPSDTQARVIGENEGAVHVTNEGCKPGMAPCLRFDQLGLALQEGEREFVGFVIGGSFEEGTLEFDYRVSSQETSDAFAVLIDDTLEFMDSGESGSARGSIPLAAGAHEIAFTYSKDSSISLGSDTAWIDNIKFVPEPTSAALGVAALSIFALLRRARGRAAPMAD